MSGNFFSIMKKSRLGLFRSAETGESAADSSSVNQSSSGTFRPGSIRMFQSYRSHADKLEDLIKALFLVDPSLRSTLFDGVMMLLRQNKNLVHHVLKGFECNILDLSLRLNVDKTILKELRELGAVESNRFSDPRPLVSAHNIRPGTRF